MNRLVCTLRYGVVRLHNDVTGWVYHVLARVDRAGFPLVSITSHAYLTRDGAAAHVDEVVAAAFAAAEALGLPEPVLVELEDAQ